MNNENLHKIFNSTDCISAEKMMAYQEGKLSEMNKNSVEKHLSSCNMCHDEFEGLLLIPVKSNLADTVFELNNQVDSILANTHKKIPFLMPINLMAAIILFVIGFAWYATYYIHSVTRIKKEQISQSVYIGSKERGEIIIIRPLPSLSESENNLRSENKNEPVSADFEGEEIKKENIPDNSLSNNKITVNNDISSTEDAIAENNSNNVSAGNIIEESNNIADDNKNFIKEDENKSSLEEKNIALDSEARNLALVEKDIMVVSNESNKKETKRAELNKAKNLNKTKSTVKNDNFNLAISKYNKQEYKAAIELFKLSFNEHKAIDEVYYYLAMSYENINAPQDALSNYNKLLSIEQSPLFEQALWNKSQILLKLNKQKSAINTLNQIKNLKGNYSKQAEIMLDSLNFK